MRRRLWVVLVTLAFVAVLFVAVFPSRTFLAQRASLSRAEEQVAVLGEQNRLLEERARLLRDDAEIERLAREEYHLVRPGEEAYVVLPGPDRAPPPERLPAAVAEDTPADDRNPLERAWDWVTDRF
ncbi:MAG: septum formation initiator family protein [Actinomycetota bacterium]|nr:septum formation initiator family protein [Actinomycetota bacterium]